MQTPANNNMWKCAPCSREMLATQKAAHVAGKAHIARVKQVPRTTPNQLSPPRTSTTKKGEAKVKVKAETAPKRPTSESTGSKGTQCRTRAAVTSTYPSYEPYGNADWGFIGFDQGGSRGGLGQDDYWRGGGDNHGLCDKDCGWCGHCMDNVDI